MAKSTDRAITVLTQDTLDSILARGGSGDWVLNPDKANECRYIVCCRKQNWRNRKEGVADRAAFMIGTIAGLRQQPDSTNARGQARYLIEISDYATVNIAGAWEEGTRNPVAYRTLADMGIDLRGTKFKKLTVGQASTALGTKPQRMTIAEAKKALAESFGVSPDDVEITIRG